MMMNFSMSRRTTTTCNAFLSVLLVASLAFVVSSINTKNGMANTTPEDDKVVKQKLAEGSDKLLYSKTYIAITKAPDFTRLFPNGGDLVSFLDDFTTRFNLKNIFSANPQFQIQGSSTTQKGAIFASDSVELVNAPDGEEVVGQFTIQVQFGGNRKLRFMPVDDPAYFFHGQCTATSGILEPQSEEFIPNVAGGTLNLIVVPQPVITSQSCKLNLCLGGGGFSCIAIYSGSAFVFNFGKGIVLNNSVDFVNGAFVPSSFEAPPLPPPFPGTIIGGTGSFEGIEGSVTITTIAGTTGPIIESDGFSHAGDGGGKQLLTYSKTKPIGSIVQVITVKSNMPLPTGP